MVQNYIPGGLVTSERDTDTWAQREGDQRQPRSGGHEQTHLDSSGKQRKEARDRGGIVRVRAIWKFDVKPCGAY